MTAPTHEIVLELILDAPKEKLYRGWTEPELMKQWFAPKPWTTPHVETDVRPGGASTVVMRSPGPVSSMRARDWRICSLRDVRVSDDIMALSVPESMVALKGLP